MFTYNINTRFIRKKKTMLCNKKRKVASYFKKEKVRLVY